MFTLGFVTKEQLNVLKGEQPRNRPYHDVITEIVTLRNEEEIPWDENLFYCLDHLDMDYMYIVKKDFLSYYQEEYRKLNQQICVDRLEEIEGIFDWENDVLLYY